MPEERSNSLAPEEERELWRLCREGDLTAREELIVAYRPLVFWIAGKLHVAPSLRQDLIQEGMLALIHAVDRFDPKREFRFSTYACHRIRGQMLNMLERSERRAPIPVPDEWIQVAQEPEDEDWLDVAESITKLQGREAEVVSALFFDGKDPRDIATEQKLDVSHVYRLRRAAVSRIRALLGLSTRTIKTAESGIEYREWRGVGEWNAGVWRDVWPVLSDGWNGFRTPIV